MNIKKELISPRKEIQKKNVEEDDESDDDDRSVITLSSDSEVEKEQKDDEENMEQDSEEDDSENDDEDETESDEDQEEEESESEDETDSVWSTADDKGDNEIITSEAIEAKIIRKFERAIVLMADNQIEQAKGILRKLLRKPIISVHQRTDLNFEEIEEISRPSKILQVYVAIHRNLATLEPEKAVEHYLQVLCYNPNNSSIWLEVALKSVDNGDLQFALYAFKKCDDKKESYEAHATVLYLTCSYSACLNLLKSYEEDVGELNDKMKYLKFKIRSTSNYYRKMCDDIFMEDDVYTDLKILDLRKVAVFDERFEEMARKIGEKREKSDSTLMDEKPMKVINVEVSATQKLAEVFTIFCDLFDRIQAHSKVNRHPIQFKIWENRKDFLEVRECLDEIVDVVECVEDLTEEASKKKNNKKSKEKYLSTWRTRLFVEEETSENTEDEDEGSDENRTESKRSSPIKELGLEENELAQEFGLVCDHIEPLNMKKQRERTPPRSSSDFTYFDEETFLDHIRTYFFITSENRQFNIIEILQKCLLKFSKFHGILKNDLKIVISEMYTRLGYCEDFRSSKYDQLNLILMEIDHYKGMDMCLKKFVSFWYESDHEEESESEEYLYESLTESQQYVRFMWKYSNTKLLDSIKLDYLYTLKNMVKDGEIVKTSIDEFEIFDVLKIIDELEKKQRIESIKQLWNSKSYQELIRICENDIDFSETDTEETEEILIFWLKSLVKEKTLEKFVQLAIRVLHFYLFSNDERTFEKYEQSIENLLKSLRIKVDFSKIDVEITSSLGYFICVALKKSTKIENNWRNWKLLYEIVGAMRDIPMIEYISTLDKTEDSHCLPSLDLDVLIKAHEALGAAKKCCENDNFDFLFFILARFREVIDDIPLLEALFEKENSWIWTNLNEEISQILNCLFGKYAKKRKCVEDHGTKGICKTDMKIANKVLKVILVQPLPLYDDKERLGHDVIDLINSKFDFLLEIKPEKQKNVEMFEEILRERAFCEVNQLSQALEEIKTYEETEIQALVWYSMALNSYKASSHDDCKKFSQLYLTSIDSSHDDRLRSSAWAILAHEHVRQLFQLDKNAIFNEWRWRIQPFKMAISAQENEAVLHFEVAATMYQLSSLLTRFIRRLPSDDLRRKRIRDGSNIRENCRFHFDKCLQLAQPSSDGTPPEYNWLCYFFLGKLAGKEKEMDIVRVVECFYEAACGCQLAGFYYPVKINTKKQTNFEPLEVHYQVHSAVWKYIDKTPDPPIDILLQLEAYLKTFANGHKIVKYAYSLFTTPPEVYFTVSEMVQKVANDGVENEVGSVLDKMITKLELIEKLKEMCISAFLLTCERFPHFKAHYRLAEAYLEKDRIDLASEQIMKNVFKRKKRDDGVFDNVVEIVCNDINRAGSFCFHVERCLRIAIYISSEMLDIHSLASILTSLIYNISIDEDRFVELQSNAKIIKSVLSAIERVSLAERPKSGRSTPSPLPAPISPNSGVVRKTVHVTPSMIRNELWKISNSLTKRKKQSENERLLAYTEQRINLLISKIYGSVQALKTKIQQVQEKQKEANDHLPKKTKNLLKRKNPMGVLEMLHPLIKRPTVITASSTTAPSTSTAIIPQEIDDDIECLDPPVPAPVSAPVLAPVTPNPQLPMIPQQLSAEQREALHRMMQSLFVRR